ncbi:MAG TPA: MarR family transcriptional regulator [Longimicrobiaceae bacterium]|nr:MarR family transcriptional regulator [Longimicrobiaceae bacterium]
MNTRRTAPASEETDREGGQTLALRLWVALARAHNAVLAHAADDVARHGLTLAEFGILEALHHRGPMMLGEVQRRILVSSGGITYLVDRLQARGLVERREDPADRRARVAALTPAGEALVRRVFPEHAARIKRALSGLGKKDKRAALGLLRALADGAGTQEPAADGALSQD